MRCDSHETIGILALPASFAQTGISSGLLLLVSVAFLTWYSVYALCICSDSTREYTYEGLSVRLFGPFGVWSTRLMTLCLLFGACVMYMVIAMDLLVPLLHLDRSTIGLGFIIIVVPLCLPDSIYALRYTNGMVVVCLAYIVW